VRDVEASARRLADEIVALLDRVRPGGREADEG
jgi:hypothetical protein